MAREKQNSGIRIIKRFENIDVSLPKLKKLIKTVRERFGSFYGPHTKYEIDIVIVDNVEILKINKQFLKHNSITDCLSFDLSEDNTKSVKLFEVIVNGEKAVKEASKRGHCAEAELALYAIHGLLHNFGFDDLQPKNAKKMHTVEDELLKQMNFGIIYNSNAD